MPVEGSVSHLELCRDAYIQHWSFQPNGQVTTDAGSCLTVLSAFGNIGPGTSVSARWCSGDPAKGGIAFRARACWGTSRLPSSHPASTRSRRASSRLSWTSDVYFGQSVTRSACALKGCFFFVRDV
jgi:hypothetical protein